ncbi:MAG: DUF4127 family protein [Clostridiales bacterium]
MKKLKAIPLIICFLLICSVGVFADAPQDEVFVDANSSVSAPIAETNKKLVYVPLDNRPVHVERVQLLAKSLGYELIIPKEDLFATKLDGQILNANGKQYGDCEKLLAWIEKMDKEGCNLFVISLDQVLSGGLVNSRIAMFEEKTPPTEGNNGEKTVANPPNPPTATDPPAPVEPVEYQNIDKLFTVLTKDPNNKVCFFDTVMRLASTVGYNGRGSDEYKALREYGKVPRAELTGDNLTIENIVKGYGSDIKGNLCENVLGDDKTGAKKALLKDKNGLLITEYLKARNRKLCLGDKVAEKMASIPNNQNFYCFIGVDDSSPGNTIQKNEIAYLAKKLGNNGIIFDGADELGVMAVTQIHGRDYKDSPGLSVNYFGESANAEGDYESERLNQVISKHIIALGAHVTQNGESPNISVLVLTPPKVTSLRYYYCKELVDKYLENVKNKVPTIIIDESSGTYYGALQDRLLAETDLGYLFGYSSWNTLGNAAGIALSEGISRYHYLMDSEVKTDDCHKAFVQMLTFGFVKDIGYHQNAKYNMDMYIKYLGYDADNFYSNNLNIAKINTELNTQLTASSGEILKNLEKSNIITDLTTYTEKGIGKIALSEFCFPWFRTFECDFNISIGAFTKPHNDPPAPVYKIVEHKPYINGYENGVFLPEKSVARGEVCKMIVTAQELQTHNFKGLYSDVKNTDWSWPFVEAATQKGYMKGYENGLFLPEDFMTRAEFASFLVKFANVEKVYLSGALKSFYDVAATDWFYTDVSRASALGLIKGYENGSFCPNQTVTRGEAVTMINRLLERSLDAEGVSEAAIGNMNPFLDINASYWGYKDVLESAVFHKFEKIVN